MDARSITARTPTEPSDDAQKHTTGARARTALLLEDEGAPPERAACIATTSRPPVLASQCLRDDLAPLEPWSSAARRISAVLALATLVVAIVDVATGALGRGAAIALVSAPLAHGALARGYERRGLATLVGGALAILVSASTSPAPASVIATFVLATACASALFFRAVYRASRGARVAIAIALGLAIAFALSSAPFGHEAPTAVRVAACGTLAVAGLAMLGFMGEETTGGCAAWGGLAVVVAAMGAFASASMHGAAMPGSLVVAALGALGALASSIGALQLAAVRFGPRLRARVDAHGRLRGARVRVREEA